MRRRAGERVDRLRRVADDAQLVAPPEPLVEHELLQGRDVLVLVDDEVAVLAPHLVGHRALRREHVAEHEEHVLEVDDRPLGLHVLVGREEARDGLVVVAGRGLAVDRLARPDVVVGGDERDLGPLDLGRQVPHRDAVHPDAEPPRRLRDDGRLVLEDARRRPADDLGPEVAELAQRGRVERARLDARRAELAQPRAHLARRAGRERHGEHARRHVHARADPVRDAVRDRARLARPRAGEHAHGSAQRDRDVALVGVERVEDLVGGAVGERA